MSEENSKQVGFIDFLDEYQKKKGSYYVDNIAFINAVNRNFVDNDLQSKQFSGVSNMNNLPQPIKKTPDFYSFLSTSNWNETAGLDSTCIQNIYSAWQEKHEVKILSPSTPIITKNVYIDASVNTISDLIHIIETNEYSEDTEYNIDLKSLNKIKTELIELNNMIGMENLKKSILDQLLYFAQDLHKGTQISEFKHTALYGSPGTGKTEIAKIIGNMYSKIGILKNNIFKKVTRNDLIAGYLGQTAIKTRKVIDECLGGVLFIDEAYSLANYDQNDSYSKECLDTLCEALSDNKENLMVIIAGYEDEMENRFFRANRGLESRFIWRFKIDSYSPSEMMQIFKKKVNEHEWAFEDDKVLTVKWFEEKKDQFKNFGRDMEMLFSYIKIAHGRRIYGKDKEMKKKITLEDLNKGYDTFTKNKKQEDNARNVLLSQIYI
jgi:SpoVK/Ycf46/Vps4 family AAA+-type ATPase